MKYPSTLTKCEYDISIKQPQLWNKFVISKEKRMDLPTKFKSAIKSKLVELENEICYFQHFVLIFYYSPSPFLELIFNDLTKPFESNHCLTPVEELFLSKFSGRGLVTLLTKKFFEHLTLVKRFVEPFLKKLCIGFHCYYCGLNLFCHFVIL